jgi:hypothetical protein
MAILVDTGLIKGAVLILIGDVEVTIVNDTAPTLAFIDGYTLSARFVAAKKPRLLNADKIWWTLGINTIAFD